MVMMHMVNLMASDLNYIQTAIAHCSPDSSPFRMLMVAIRSRCGVHSGGCEALRAFARHARDQPGRMMVSWSAGAIGEPQKCHGEPPMMPSLQWFLPVIAMVALNSGAMHDSSPLNLWVLSLVGPPQHRVLGLWVSPPAGRDEVIIPRNTYHIDPQASVTCEIDFWMLSEVAVPLIMALLDYWQCWFVFSWVDWENITGCCTLLWLL